MPKNEINMSNAINIVSFAFCNRCVISSVIFARNIYEPHEILYNEEFIR